MLYFFAMSNYLIKASLQDAISELPLYKNLQALLLKNRGIESETAADIFLHPDYDRDIYDPFLIDGMDRAVTRILDGIARNEKIIIYTDYDCDGIPGGVILHDFFKKINYQNVSNYIPHRHKEGYGLHIDAINRFVEQGATLLITADLGITNIKEVAYAEEKGINVVLTDHHLPHEEIKDGESVQILPPAYVVINAKKKTETYPDKMLCGAATAWKLVCALSVAGKKRLDMADVSEPLLGFKNIGEGWEKWLLDMAGLSTIADMVPLVHENRVIATFGLKVLRKSRRPGLQKLLRKTNTLQSTLTEDDIGFTIAPRINAASRMDIPMEGFKLFATTDDEEASRLAEHLHTLNDTRKVNVATIMKEVHHTLRDRELPPLIVIGNPEWSPGVLGLLANKILETYARPAFVWGRGEEGTHFKGSCRSDGVVNVVDLMLAVPHQVFLNVGGHELSGGFSVHHDYIHDLERELACAYEKVKRNDYVPAKNLFIDCTLTIDDVSLDTYKQIEPLAPFGTGNQKPTFLFQDVVLHEIKRFGKEKNHLELQLKKINGDIVKAIGFFMTEKSFEETVGVLEKGKTIQLVAQFEKSIFGGKTELRLRIVDCI